MLSVAHLHRKYSQAKLPFTHKATLLAVQSECSDLRRTRDHLIQDTRPSKKFKNIHGVLKQAYHGMPYHYHTQYMNMHGLPQFTV